MKSALKTLALNSRKKKIYLDHNATTYVREEVKNILNKFFYMSSPYGNPSSVYDFGIRSAKYIMLSKKTIADTLLC